MDSFEWNKIFGAVLGTALFVVALNIVVGGFMKPHKAEKPGMEVVVTETSGPAETPVAEVAPDWGTVLPAADLAAGEKVHERCLQCHDFASGGPNKIGPNLYGVVGAKHAHSATFAYSTAMKALGDKTWGYDELDAFLKNPKGAVPGTKMAFAGLSKAAERINVIAYLRTLSDSPLAIPAPNPAAATPPPAPTTPAAPGDGTEPAGELQATPPAAPGTTPPAAPGATPPIPGSSEPAPAPGTSVPANPTTTAPTTTPAAPPAPAKPPGH